MAAPALVASSLVLATAIPASAEGFLPDPEDFRLQRITRASTESDWPFSVSSGLLGCNWALGQRAAFFIEDLPPSPERRAFQLSFDPIVLLWMNIAARDLLVEGLSDEQIILLTAPYTSMAIRLCDQPPGTFVDSDIL